LAVHAEPGKVIRCRRDLAVLPGAECVVCSFELGIVTAVCHGKGCEYVGGLMPSPAAVRAASLRSRATEKSAKSLLAGRLSPEYWASVVRSLQCWSRISRGN